MSLFGMFRKSPPLAEGFARYQAAPGAALLDVRTPEEYAGGHLPGSCNVPLDSLADFRGEKNVPVFVYCHSGARSAEACALLQKSGYTAQNIGGVAGYTGALERG